MAYNPSGYMPNNSNDKMEYDLSDYLANNPRDCMATNSCDHMANNSSGPDEAFIGEHIERAARVAIVVIGSVMILSAVIGNFTFIHIVRKHFVRNTKKNTHDLFLINLAVTDILIMGYWFSFFILDLSLGYHPVANKVHCTANALIIAVLFLVSATSLVSISFNRYLGICHSHLYKRVLTLPRTVCWCLLTWLFSFSIALPPVFGGAAGCYHYNPTNHVCSFCREKTLYPKVVVSLYTVLLPFVVIYFNSAIYRFWRKERLSLTPRYPLTRKKNVKRKTLITRFRPRRTKKNRKVILGALAAEAAIKRGVRIRRQNTLKMVDHSRRIADTEICVEETDTPSVDFGKMYKTALKPEEKSETPCVPEEDSLLSTSDTKVFNSNSHGLQVKENTTVSASYNADSDYGMINTEDISSDNEEEKTRGQLQASHRETGEYVMSNTPDHAEELKTGTDDKSLDSGFRRCESTSENPRSFWENRIYVNDKRRENHDTTKNNQNPVGETPPSASRLSTPRCKPKQSISPNCGKREERDPRMHVQQHQLRKKGRVKEEALVRCLLVVCILMSITFLPFAVLVIVDSYVKQPSKIHIAANSMLFLNNSVNWIVYGTMNPAFRKVYVMYVRQVFKSCRRPRSDL